MLIGTDQAQIWRELERIEQRLSRGVDSAASQLYDSMGRPATQAFTNFGNHFALGLARVDRVRQALDQSGPMARRMVEQQLSGIGIATVWDILVAACKEIALYYGGAVVTGAALGGAIGSAAFGVGAVPGAVIGTAAGAQVGTWVMALMGLKELAEGLAGMLPAALDHYERGFREAWGAAPEERRDTWRSTISASGNTYTAAWHLSQGHAIMVGAILTALVAYLTRGRGNKAVLMQEIRKSPKLGQKFADWLVENEGKLLGHPRLQSRPRTPAGMAMEGVPANGHGGSPLGGGLKAGGSGGNTVGKKLLPTEGNVGTYDELIAAGSKGDNITPHHIPSANRMAQSGVGKGDGIAINMEQPFPGEGGRHRATFTYGTKADMGMSPRDALAAGVWDARRIYMQDGLYGPEIRSSLQDLIKQNKATFPNIFGKE